MLEDKIKQYFFGQLTAAEADNFEEETAWSDEATAQVKLVESEIIDAYLRGELSPNKRRLFETNYLTTEAREEKLELARIFLNNFKARVVAESQPSIWQRFFAAFQPRFVLAGTAAVLLTGFLIYFLQNRQPATELAEMPNVNQTGTFPPTENSNQPNANQTNQNAKSNLPIANINANKKTSPPEPKKSPTPEIKTTPNATPITPSDPTLASFALFPGSLRSNGEQVIKLLPHTKKINLRLNLPKDLAVYQSYRATVKTADGETVSNFINLKSLNLTVTANQLKNDTYIIFLEGNNPPKPAESVAEYTFRVSR